jgi:hypothetical protein
VLGAYGLSLLLPAIPGKVLVFPGWWAFVIALTGGGAFLPRTEDYAFEWIFLIGWLPNPFFLMGLFFFLRDRFCLAALCACVASVVGSGWLFYDFGREYINARHQIVMSGEYHLACGYFVWLNSFLLLACMSAARLVTK